MELFGIASRQAQWLSERFGVIAGNIANANTPGYKAKDVAPFSSVLQNWQTGLRQTNPRHLNVSGKTGPSQAEVHEEDAGRVSHSGNSVSLERELMKGAEVVRAYQLNVNVTRAFHRMLLMSLKDN